MLIEIVDSSLVAIFNLIRVLKMKDMFDGEITISITDDCAHVQYYVVCLKSERERYRKIFDNLKEEGVC